MVIAAGVAAQSIDFTVQEGRPVTTASFLESGRNGLIQFQRIASVDVLNADVCGENAELERIEAVGVCTDSVAVVFDQKNGRQLPLDRKANAFVNSPCRAAASPNEATTTPGLFCNCSDQATPQAGNRLLPVGVAVLQIL